MASANYILQQPGFPLIWTALNFVRTCVPAQTRLDQHIRFGNRARHYNDSAMIPRMPKALSLAIRFC